MKANIFSSIGKYALFLRQAFKKPESRKMLRKQFIVEIDRLIMSSIVIVGVISLFMGGVLVIQTASNMENPFLDRMLIGYMVRESMILEFSSTMVALILAGKMGSSIASEIGSASYADSSGRMHPLNPASEANSAIGRAPGTALIDASRPSSPMIRYFSSPGNSRCPEAAMIPMAMGTS